MIPKGGNRFSDKIMLENASPVSAAESKSLFADLAQLPTLILAVSGGPDSTALLVLAARWRASLKSGPTLVAITVDHRLRPESAREASAVKKLARKLGVAHRTLRWTARKPKTGLQAAAREARYGLLADAASAAGARHVLTAHTRDDQAETVLIRLARGSGIVGLAAMARISPLPAFNTTPSPTEPGLARVPPDPAQVGQARLASGEGRGGGYRESLNARAKLPPSRRALHADLPHKGGGEDKKSPRGADDRLLLVRPLLDVPKARLIATLKSARIGFADDPTNRNPQFTRVRIRELMPALAQEGLNPARLSLLARRLARANAAVERAVDAAYHDLLQTVTKGPLKFDAEAFRRLPDEVALRLLGRAIARRGDEGPVELGKLESLYDALPATPASRFRRTLAGALVTLEGDRLIVERAPPRRPQAGRLPPLTKRKGGRRKVVRRR